MREQVFPRRGDVWRVQLDPVVGHEQGRQRPVAVVSSDRLNTIGAGLLIVCPVTRTERRIEFHIEVDPPEGGLTARSFVQCDQARTISTKRLRSRMGTLRPATMSRIANGLRLVFDL